MNYMNTKNKKEYHPTDIEIEQAVALIYYEIKQLIDSTLLSQDVKDIRFKNAFVESVLVHTRILIEFFENERRWKDDVLTSDFGFSPKKLNISDHDRDRLNKDLAHLTYSRLNRSHEEKNWDYINVVLPILIRASEYIKFLLNEYLVPKKPYFFQFKQLLDDINKIIIVNTSDELSES